MSDLSELSKRTWVARAPVPTQEELMLGCLQRIAAALEKSAGSWDALVRERDGARQGRDYWQRSYHSSERRCAALRGVITRLKKKGGAA